jgi:hypothetical protein
MGANVFSTSSKAEVTMFNPFGYEMYAKSHHAELLKEAAQSRAARMARGDTPQSGAGWRMIALSLTVLAVGLVLLTGLL